MLVTITRIYEKEINTSKGKFMSLNIKCEEHKEKWLTGWKGELNQDWKVGDKVNISSITEVKGKNKKTYYNYKPIKPSGQPDIEGDEIEHGIKKRHFQRLKGQSIGNARTNAVNIVIKMYEKGDITREEIIPQIEFFINFLFEYRPGSQSIPEEF